MLGALRKIGARSIASSVAPARMGAAPLRWSRWQSSAAAFRVEKDTFGDIKVQADRYWGAQTQRYVFECCAKNSWPCTAIAAEEDFDQAWVALTC